MQPLRKGSGSGCRSTAEDRQCCTAPWRAKAALILPNATSRMRIWSGSRSRAPFAIFGFRRVCGQCLSREHQRSPQIEHHRPDAHVTSRAANNDPCFARLDVLVTAVDESYDGEVKHVSRHARVEAVTADCQGERHLVGLQDGPLGCKEGGNPRRGWAEGCAHTLQSCFSRLCCRVFCRQRCKPAVTARASEAS